MLVDEQHVIVIVGSDGTKKEIACARLNDNDDVETMRAAVEAENDGALAAFEKAFEQVEATPGNSVIAEAPFDQGAIRIILWTEHSSSIRS